MIGPPGAGKSLAAGRLPSILPPLARGRGARGGADRQRLRADRRRQPAGRPFRAPHHTISPAGLVGGGAPPRPGEVTLAHRGVLFLDELCEFRRDALEALRAPLEAGEVSIARAGGGRALPCRFMLVAASNPCPCGRGEADPECSCSPAAVQRYRVASAAPSPTASTSSPPSRQPERRRDRRPPGRALGGGAGAGGRGARAPGAPPRRRPLQRRDDARRRRASARSSADAGGAPGGALRAPSAQRPRPRPGAAAGADDRRPGRARDDRRRRDGAGAAAAEAGPWLSPPPAPIACAAPGCSPCSAPTSRRWRPARSDRARRNCCGSPTRTGRGGGAEGRRSSCWAGSRRCRAADLRAELAAAGCWACCRHGDLYPVGAARRRRRALGADRPRRPAPARRPRAVRRGDRSSAPAAPPPTAARSPASWVASWPPPGIDRRQRPRLRDRRLRPPRRRRRRPHDRRPRLRSRHRLPGRPPLALAADQRGGPGALRAAARRRALALDLPGPQPDHGRAGRDDRRRRGGGPLGLADHRRPGRRPRPRPRRRPRPGHLPRLGRAQQPPRRRRLRGPRRPGRPRRDARARRQARSSAPAPPLDASWRRSSPPSRSGEGTLRRRRRRPRPPGPDAAAALARLELLGYLTCSRSGAYSRTLLARRHGAVAGATLAVELAA